jgi:arsenate reductase
MTQITIYHNPGCGTSRNALALIRGAGLEPQVIEYLKTPPDRATLEALLSAMNMRPLAHPILINRPIVITPSGTRLCRPSETVLEILPPRTE